MTIPYTNSRNRMSFLREKAIFYVLKFRPSSTDGQLMKLVLMFTITPKRKNQKIKKKASKNPLKRKTGQPSAMKKTIGKNRTKV